LFKLNGMQKEVFRCKLGRVDFLKTGSAAKVVFVHGIADRKEAFEPICDALAGSYPCFSLDLPAKVFGSGTSNQSIVEQIASLYSEFLRNHAEEKVVLFGSSFGSTVAVQLAHMMPELVAGLVLQGGFVYRPLNFFERIASNIAQLLPFNVAHIPFMEEAVKFQHFHGFVAQPPEKWDRFIRNISPSKSNLTARYGQAIHKVDHRSIALKMGIPVLLIDGEKDPLVDMVARNHLYQAFPNAEKVIITGGGHLLPYSHYQEIADHTRRFLSKVFDS